VNIRATGVLSALHGQDRLESMSRPLVDKPLSYDEFLEWLREQQLESDRYLARQMLESEKFLAQQMLEFEHSQAGRRRFAKSAGQW
jgi:hypothetical protein